MDEFKAVVTFTDVLSGVTVGFVLFLGVRLLFRRRHALFVRRFASPRDFKALNLRPVEAILPVISARKQPP